MKETCQGGEPSLIALLDIAPGDIQATPEEFEWLTSGDTHIQFWQLDPDTDLRAYCIESIKSLLHARHDFIAEGRIKDGWLVVQ